jgi:beta-lactamase superfamily II metal-dependent hydrolase
MLTIHFLNVGHGDCTIIEHESKNITVIDIHNGNDLDPMSKQELQGAYKIGSSAAAAALLFENKSISKLLLEKGYDVPLTNPVEYLQTHFPGRSIFRYIQTHPDLDHMRGLCALKTQGISIVNFWDTRHEKEPDFQSDDDEAEWTEYLRLRASENSPRVLRNYRGYSGIYYNQNPAGVAGGDNIEILSPTPELESASNEADKTNNLSYVLRVSYKGIKVILGADAEKDAWDSILGHYGADLKCNVLKASHHGRDSGYHQAAVETMKPQYAIVSVGKKPDTDASNKYRTYCDNVWSTRWRGNITLAIDDQGKGTIVPEYDR